MLIAYLQIFAIGLSMGLIGPCLVYCLPIVLTFSALTQKNYKNSFFLILNFFIGRLLAYMMLAFLAGISGLALRHFIESNIAAYLRPAAGVISVVLGVYILVLARQKEANCNCAGKNYSKTGLFGMGFLIGLSPCIPLTALLFQIALISKSALDGVLYGLFFGLGTLTSGFIAAAVLSGLLGIAPAHLLKSEIGKIIFKTTCSLILILFGIWLIIGK